MNRTWIGLVALVLLGTPTPHLAADEGLRRLAVRQVQQLDIGLPTVRAYLDLTDSQGNRIAELSPTSVSATLGQWTAEPVALRPFDPSEQGIAYVFLVDVSKSLSRELFREMTGSLEAWIDDLRPLDRAAVIAFGESSRVVVDFTDDRQRLREALRSLGPVDEQTLLHRALVDALDLCRRLDPDLPGRRAIVVFSDGKDEGSGLDAEDVLARLRNEPSPIHAVGYSGIRDAAERQTYLDLLRRFAANSGGVFLEAQARAISQAHDAIRRAIGRVWVADFRCGECRPDGTVQRLQVRVDIDGAVLSDGGAVRLLPVRGAAGAVDPPATPAAAAEAPPELASGAAADHPVPEPPADGPIAATRRSVGRGWMLLLAAILALAGFGFWRFKATRRRPSRAAALEPIEQDAVPVDPIALPRWAEHEQPIGPPPARAPGATRTAAAAARTGPAGKRVRLIVVRGSRRGRQYAVEVTRAAVVGRRSDCDLVLSDEPGIEPQQFELTYDSGALYVRDLAEHNPTLLGGQPVAGKTRVDSDALLGTGSTILRVVYH